MFEKIKDYIKNKNWFDKGKEEGEEYRKCFALLGDQDKVNNFSNFYDSNREQLEVITAYLVADRALEGSFNDKEFFEFKKGVTRAIGFFYASHKECEITLSKMTKKL